MIRRAKANIQYINEHNMRGSKSSLRHTFFSASVIEFQTSPSSFPFKPVLIRKIIHPGIVRRGVDSPCAALYAASLSSYLGICAFRASLYGYRGHFSLGWLACTCAGRHTCCSAGDISRQTDTPSFRNWPLAFPYRSLTNSTKG